MNLQDKNAPLAGKGAEEAHTRILNDLHETIKSDLLAGKAVRPIDFPEDQRPHVVGAIAALRDELPIRSGWTTIQESHLSQTRLRARSYKIPGEFLRGCA